MARAVDLFLISAVLAVSGLVAFGPHSTCAPMGGAPLRMRPTWSPIGWPRSLVARGLLVLHRVLLRHRQHRERRVVAVPPHGDPYAGSTDPHSAGNGSLMRLAPVPMCFAGDAVEAIAMAADSSRTTHQAQEAVDACRYFAGLLIGALLRVVDNASDLTHAQPIPVGYFFFGGLGDVGHDG